MLWTFVALLACDGIVNAANLPPTPVGHLTPPKQTPLQGVKGNVIQNLQPSKESLTGSLARWFLSGSKVSSKSQSGQSQNTVKKRQEKQIASASDVKAIFLAPGYSILSDQGKGLDCNPCDSVPWVPMSRALNGRSYPKVPQYTLSVPTIQVAFPIKEIHYTVPVHQQTQQFHSPGGIDDVNIDYDKPESEDDYAPPGEYSSPPALYGKPSGAQPLPLYGAPQQNPSTNYGPPFSQGSKPLNQFRPPNVNRPSLSYLPAAGAFFGATQKNVQTAQTSYPQQQQSPSLKVPVLVQNPIPFPLLSTNLVPPMYPYQQFSDGKSLQATSQQSVAEPDDVCNKCKEQNKVNDSVSSSAHSQSTGSTQFEVMKSIPLAEFLASVEYPLQIIQAPILDVPDLPKYFNLGFQHFPHLQEKLNGYHNPSSSKNTQGHTQGHTQGFSQQNIGHALFVNNGLQEQEQDNVKSSSFQPTVSATSGGPSPTTELGTLASFPTNHKHAESTTNYLSSTDQPSQQFDVNSKGSTSGSTIPPTPHVTLANSLQLPSQDSPVPFLGSFNTSSLDQQSNTLIQGEKVSDLRYLSPPPLPSSSAADWLLSSSPLPTLSPWASTPPRPFHLPTHKPRFVVRPSPTPIKKPKLVHQIIVPYTTSKQTQQAFNLNNQGWTPLPPGNQGRKVPPPYSFGERLPNVGAYQDPTNNESQLSKVPLSATGSDNLEDIRFPNGHSPLNLSPEMMDQILKQWPLLANTAPGGIQHILSENLQALLNDKEDAIDFERLQKNIDNWTAEGFKQTSPSVNFGPITTLTHLAPSKKIPEEYLTTESTSHNSTGSVEEEFYKRSTLSPFDYEVSASNNNVVKAVKDPHVKFIYNDSDSSLIEEINGWSLLDTKMKDDVPGSGTTTEASEQKEKLWDKIPVSFSSLTNEKVYVVTPLTQVERTTDSPVTVKNTSSMTSSRVERSYSVQRSGKIEKIPHLLHNFIKAEVKADGSQIDGKVNTDKSTEEEKRHYTTDVDTIDDEPTLPTPKPSTDNLQDDDAQYIRNFPDLFQLLETQEDGEALRRAAVELKREKQT